MLAHHLYQTYSPVEAVVLAHNLYRAYSPVEAVVLADEQNIEQHREQTQAELGRVAEYRRPIIWDRNVNDNQGLDLTA